MPRFRRLLPLLCCALALAACDSASDEPEVEVPEVSETVLPSSTVIVAYEGRLADGAVFDQSSRATFSLARVIPGFRAGVVGMRAGEEKTFAVPPDQGYGNNPPAGIPPGATLTFTVALLDFDVAQPASVVTVLYEGRLADGTVFDRNARGARFSLARVIPGFRDGVVGMRVGEARTFEVAPEDGYGDTPPSGIPPGATLTFDVTLLDVDVE